MCLIDIDDDGGGTADCKGQDGADNSVYTAVIPAVFCVLAVAMVITFALLKREQGISELLGCLCYQYCCAVGGQRDRTVPESVTGKQ